MPAASGQGASKAAGGRRGGDEGGRKRRRKAATAAEQGATGGRQKAASQPAASPPGDLEEDVIDLSQGPDDGAVHADDANFINVDDEVDGDAGPDESRFADRSAAAAATRNGVNGRDSSSNSSLDGRSNQKGKMAWQNRHDQSAGDTRGAEEDTHANEFAEAWAEASAEAEAEGRKQSACSTCACSYCGKDRYTDSACAYCNYMPRQEEAESPVSDATSLSPRSLRRRRERERAAARAAGVPATPPPVYEILSDSSDLSDVEGAPLRRKQAGPRGRDAAAGCSQAANSPRTGDSSGGRGKSSYDLTASNSDDDENDVNGDDPVPEDDDDEDCELELI